MSLKQVQLRLKALGYDPGTPDGLYGPKTESAINDALDVLSRSVNIAIPNVSPDINVIPEEWLPWAQMRGVVLHWTVGRNQANGTDKKHYHLILEDPIKWVKGNYSILDNESTRDGKYAAHVSGMNTGFIGISLAGMLGAKESPLTFGKYPITENQYNAAAQGIAQICQRYGIPVTNKTVLTHAEVQPVLGIKQRGKWDITHLPWNPSIKGYKAVGDDLRRRVESHLTS